LSVKKQINTDLVSIADWSTRNGLCLNSQKTQAMDFFLRKPKVDDTAIPFSTKIKNLGVILNCDFTWNDQISSVVSGMNAV
jgi:hypothetical protein